VVAVASITLLSPLGGEAWESGSTQFVRWTANNAGDIVVCYSIDNGETWAIICDNSVPFGSPEYGNFPWVVPVHDLNTVRVKLYSYSATSVYTMSESFTIRPSNSTGTRAAAGKPVSNAISIAGPGVIRVSYPDTDAPVRVELRSLDGSQAVSLPLSLPAGQTGKNVTMPGGLSSGMYIAYLISGETLLAISRIVAAF
jgi:hypothetical protein